MSSFLENAYSLIHQDNAADVPTMSELRTQLEKGTDESKVGTMKSILTIMLNGDPMPQLLMHIIRFVMPSKSKPLKKLLYFYYEICPKLDSSGKLKQEMILVWYVFSNLSHTHSLTTHPWLPNANCIPFCSAVTASETISNIPTSTFEAIPCASCASSANLSSSSPSFPPPDLASSTVTHMYERMPSLPSPPSSSTRPR